MSSRLATLYTPRTLAVACLYDTLRDLNFRIAGFQAWVDEIGKVDDGDVDGYSLLQIFVAYGIEAVDDLRKLIREGIGKDIQ